MTKTMILIFVFIGLLVFMVSPAKASNDDQIACIVIYDEVEFLDHESDLDEYYFCLENGDGLDEL